MLPTHIIYRAFLTLLDTICQRNYCRPTSVGQSSIDSTSLLKLLHGLSPNFKETFPFTMRCILHYSASTGGSRRPRFLMKKW